MPELLERQREHRHELPPAAQREPQPDHMVEAGREEQHRRDAVDVGAEGEGLRAEVPRRRGRQLEQEAGRGEGRERDRQQEMLHDHVRVPAADDVAAALDLEARERRNPRRRDVARIGLDGAAARAEQPEELEKLVQRHAAERAEDQQQVGDLDRPQQAAAARVGAGVDRQARELGGRVRVAVGTAAGRLDVPVVDRRGRIGRAADVVVLVAGGAVGDVRAVPEAPLAVVRVLVRRDAVVLEVVARGQRGIAVAAAAGRGDAPGVDPRRALVRPVDVVDPVAVGADRRVGVAGRPALAVRAAQDGGRFGGMAGGADLHPVAAIERVLRIGDAADLVRLVAGGAGRRLGDLVDEDGAPVDRALPLADDVLAVLPRVAGAAGVGEPLGVDRGRGVVLAADLVRPVAGGAGRLRPFARLHCGGVHGCLAERFGDVGVARAAIDGREPLGVRDRRVVLGEVGVALGAGEPLVLRPLEGVGRDDEPSGAFAGVGEGVLRGVAGEADVVRQRPRGGNGRQSQ